MTVHTKENYPDPIDRASELEMMSTEDAIRQARKGNVQKQLPNDEGEYPDPYCADCGDDINPERLRVAQNNHLCIVCATRVEKLKGRMRA